MSGSTSTLGKYQIIREIARSNDIVYEAYDPIMNRRVALKELSMPGGSTDQQREDRRNRFLREARAAGTLTHPNIVTVYEYGEEAGRHFIAMEFLEGHTLRNELDTKGFLGQERSVEVATAVLEALEYAHDRGVIHRDIKPDNIQLLPDGRVKLTDFGIARLTFEPNLTMDGQVFGTPSYMSPEQVVGKDIDARSDLFSVGVVLFEMLSGQKPFAGDSVVSITYAIMNSTPQQPSQINWAMWQVVERALEKSSPLRYASAKELRGALAAAVQASSGTVIDPLPQSPQTPMAPPANNPYVSPYPQAFGAPGQQVYTYNPYQPQPNQGTYPPGSYPQAQYPQPGQAPIGFTPPPVYYPPAPRQPLMKPETKQFLGKLMLALVILGTVFGLALVTIGAITTVIDRQSNQRADAQLVDQLRKLPSDMSLAQQIGRYEEALGKFRDPVTKRTEQNNLAVLYERLGKQQMASDDPAAAEASFTKAIEKDPQNAAFPSNLGELYGSMARKAFAPTDRLAWWQESSKYWSQAAMLERDANKRAVYATGAAQAHLAAAKELIFLNRTEDARSALYAARDFAEPNSAEAKQVNQLLSELL